MRSYNKVPSAMGRLDGACLEIKHVNTHKAGPSLLQRSSVGAATNWPSAA